MSSVQRNMVARDEISDSDDRKRLLCKPELRLAADYGASPPWTLDGNIPIEDVALSWLNAELHCWATEFDATHTGTRMKR